jgi:hypothetical protein
VSSFHGDDCLRDGEAIAYRLSRRLVAGLLDGQLNLPSQESPNGGNVKGRRDVEEQKREPIAADLMGSFMGEDGSELFR